MKILLHPSYPCEACLRRWVKRLILQHVYKKYLPMLVRSLPVQVNRWIRPGGIATYKKHRRYSIEVRGSRWISNFRQTCLIATSSLVENVEEWSFWELEGETPSLSTFSWVGADITEERRNCNAHSSESLSKPTRPADVYMLIYTET
jgi:hypothetical protein